MNIQVASFEAKMKERLGGLSKEISEESDAIRTAVRTQQASPLDSKEFLKKVSVTILEAQQTIADHANGTLRVSDDLLKTVGKALAAAHTALDDLILLIAATRARSN